MKECKVCRIMSRVMGGRIVMPIVCRNDKKIFFSDIEKYTDGLDIRIVGGLADRGHTHHDIDVVGDKKDLLVFVERLIENHIFNPVHYCGGHEDHSHLKCTYYGLKLVFTGKGY